MEEQILNLFINNISQFVFWKDRNSNYLGCNNNFAHSAGYKTPEDLIGKTDYDMPWSKEEADFFRKIDKEVMDSGKPQLNFEEPQTLIDGSKRWLSTSKIPLFDDKRNVIGILGWYIDITNYKLMEFQIDKNNKTLLDYNLQLEKSKKALEIANYDLEKFTYAVSHDLKTPIRSIVSFAQLIKSNQRKNLDKNVVEYTDYIINSGHRMNTLVEDILNYARTGTSDLSPEKIRIENLLSKKLLDLDQLILSKSAEVKLDLHDDLIFCYPNLIGIVFYNLIHNGIKFNTDKKPLVICKSYESKTDWTFSISDNGIGIDPIYSKKIFEPFKRLAGANFEGSGIGLSICKRIVNIHNGDIWIENNSSSGSTFKFSISKNIS